MDDSATDLPLPPTELGGPHPAVQPPPGNADPNQEFAVSFQHFAQSLRGSADEVWTHLLRRAHGTESHVMAEWKALIEKYRHAPAHRQ